jgi:hypothetical protein
VPLRPVPSSVGAQPWTVAALAVAMLRAAAQTSAATPICPAAARADRSAADSARCRASTAAARSVAANAMASNSAEHASTQMLAEPASRGGLMVAPPMARRQRRPAR